MNVCMWVIGTTVHVNVIRRQHVLHIGLPERIEVLSGWQHIERHVVQHVSLVRKHFGLMLHLLTLS